MPPSQCFDLHTHSTASDGKLSPGQLLLRAENNGVAWLALTDHDTVAGVRELQQLIASRERASSSRVDTQLVPGVEITALAGKLCVHIVGLWVDTASDTLDGFLQRQRAVRDERGERIAKALEKSGIAGTLAGAKCIAGDAVLARPHFAQYLVEQSICSSMQHAFNRFLGRGKAGDVKCEWPSMRVAIETIHASGGRAVLAHPDKYKLTATKMRHLLDEFVALGGSAVEVVNGAQALASSAYLARLADRRGLSCSTGSDFHSSDQVWCDLGRQPQMPAGVTPVWA